jgi:hypothetical protein
MAEQLQALYDQGEGMLERIASYGREAPASADVVEYEARVVAALREQAPSYASWLGKDEVAVLGPLDPDEYQGRDRNGHVLWRHYWRKRITRARLVLFKALDLELEG